jgi:peptidoglycan DL-endopeptidase CwlO
VAPARWARHRSWGRRHLVGLSVLALATLTTAALPQSGMAAPAPTLDQVKAQLADLATQAEVAQERLNQARVDIAAGQRVLAEKQARVSRSQARVAALQVGVDRIASQQYRSGGFDPTVQALLADNPNKFLEQLAAVDLVSQHQADLLRTASVASQRLAQDKLAAAQQVDRLRALYTQAALDYQQVRAAQTKAAALFDSLQAAQRAAILQARAQARAQALAAARAALAQAQAAARAAADAAAAARAAKARTSTTTTTSGHAGPSTRPFTRSGGSGHSRGGGSGGSGSGSSGSIGQRVVAYALARVGDAYVWGAAGPTAYDCSGLTMRAYQSVGISLPHSSTAQHTSGRQIASTALQPGDLVFYYRPIHHVGIYIGHGMIVNAENPSVGVIVAPLYSMPYVGAVRPY